MAEGCSTTDSTVSPTPIARESTYQERKRRRAERYLAGVARASHRLEGSLEASLSSPDVSLCPEDSDEEVSEAIARKRSKRELTCQRGCAVALKRLAVTYHNVGIHTGKTAQYRKSSYPSPKNGAAPRNLTSKFSYYSQILIDAPCTLTLWSWSMEY